MTLAMFLIFSFSVFANQICIFYTNSGYSLEKEINKKIKEGWTVEIITYCDNGIIVVYNSTRRMR